MKTNIFDKQKIIWVGLGYPRNVIRPGSGDTTVDSVDQSVYIGVSLEGEIVDRTYILSEWSAKKDIKKPKVESRWNTDGLYGKILAEKEREEPKRLENERRIDFGSGTAIIFEYLDKLVELNPGYKLSLDFMLQQGLRYKDRLKKISKLIGA